MISYQEAIEKGLKIVGMEPPSEFVVSSRSYKLSLKIIPLVNKLQELFNQKLQLANYSNNVINRISFIFIILNDDPQNTNHPERKYFKRSEKHFFIDIRFPDYEAFCNADEQTALKIMAEQTLRGAKKFLPKVKGFDFDRFYRDLTEVLKPFC